MTAFRNGQRVIVRTCEGDNGKPTFLGGAPGTVARIRRDGGAWVALDARSQTAGAHPFDDTGRATHVLTWPDCCAVVETTP